MSENSRGAGYSPLDYWRAPLTRGFAAVLTSVNLVGLAWFAGWQNGRLDDVQRTVSSEVSSLGSTFPGADPDLCWLIGMEARTSGHEKKLLSALTDGTTLSDCLTRAQEGAIGQRPR